MSVTLSVNVSLMTFKAIQDVETVAKALRMFQLGPKAADSATESVLAVIKAIKDAPYEVTAKKTTAGQKASVLGDEADEKTADKDKRPWAGWVDKSYANSIVSECRGDTPDFSPPLTEPPYFSYGGWNKIPVLQTPDSLYEQASLPATLPQKSMPFRTKVPEVNPPSKAAAVHDDKDRTIIVILHYHDGRTQQVTISPYALVSDLLDRCGPWLGDVKLLRDGQVIARSRISSIGMRHSLKGAGIKDGDVISVRRDTEVENGGHSIDCCQW